MEKLSFHVVNNWGREKNSPPFFFNGWQTKKAVLVKQKEVLNDQLEFLLVFVGRNETFFKTRKMGIRFKKKRKSYRLDQKITSANLQDDVPQGDPNLKACAIFDHT